MNSREKAICARVREFRKGVNWSQAALAKELGITRNRLASIEYGRTPLPYNIAWKLRTVCGLSLTWLDVGDAIPNEADAADLPPPWATGLEDNALLTEVSARFHGNVRSHTAPHRRRQIPDLAQRWIAQTFLKGQVEVWMPEIPEGHIQAFVDALVLAGQSYLKSLPVDSEGLIEARAYALTWEEMAADLAKRVLPQDSKNPLAGPQRLQSLANYALRTISFSGNFSGVKAQWPSLKRKLQHAVKQKGKRAALAKFLGVKMPSVSRWLSDSEDAREPGAETTLRMIEWLGREQQTS